jgi:hypothetical protein
MSFPQALSALLAAAVLALAACHLLLAPARQTPLDGQARRREWMAWEVRGLVVAVTGPCAAGIYFGRLPADYALPLALFVAAGFLTAGLIAPPGRD